MEEKRLQIALTEVTIGEDGQVLDTKPVVRTCVPHEAEFNIMKMVAEFEHRFLKGEET